MVTIQQLVKKKVKRKHKFHKSKTVVLKKCPQKKGISVRVFTEKPKKPNSAKRQVVKVYLSTGKNIRAMIPGEGHNIVKYKRVYIRGGRRRDLPGIRCQVMRGIGDCLPVLDRRKARSKYAVKRYKP